MDPYERYLATNPKQCVVCGAAFAGAQPAITKEFTGEYYSFCSSPCIAAFEADPEQYIGGDEESEG